MININFPTHIEVLAAFVKFEVRFLLVGGYAVINYGYHRSTGDMDLWIDSTAHNKQLLLKAFSSLGYDEQSLAHLASLDLSTPTVFSVGEPPEKIDFMTHINLVDFHEAYTQRVVGELKDGLLIPIINYKHLIMSKINTDRLKDKADVEELQKINTFRKKR